MSVSDPRWARLLDREWTCRSCDGAHRGIFDLGSSHPQYWSGVREPGPNSAALARGNFLSEDFCVVDEHCFIRCVLEIPLLGLEGERFGYGVWSSLSKKNFDLYVQSFDSGETQGLGPWFGWFSNRLKDYPDTLGLKCRVHLQSGRQRPLIELEPTDHALAIEQREGIGYDRLLAIYAANGHVMESRS